MWNKLVIIRLPTSNVLQSTALLAVFIECRSGVVFLSSLIFGEIIGFLKRIGFALQINDKSFN